MTSASRKLRRCELVDDIVVVTSEPGAEALARGAGAQVVADDPGEGHSEAAQRGIDWAVADGAFHTLLIAGDIPAVDPTEIDSLIESLADNEVVIIPDRHGSGTNALLLTPPGVISPSFGERSCQRHQQIAADAGATARVEASFGIGLDIDNRRDELDLRAARESADRSAIAQALARAEGNISNTAKLLGVSRPTLYDLLKSYYLHA